MNGSFLLLSVLACVCTSSLLEHGLTWAKILLDNGPYWSSWSFLEKGLYSSSGPLLAKGRELDFIYLSSCSLCERGPYFLRTSTLLRDCGRLCTLYFSISSLLGRSFFTWEWPGNLCTDVWRKCTCLHLSSTQTSVFQTECAYFLKDLQVECIAAALKCSNQQELWYCFLISLFKFDHPTLSYVFNKRKQLQQSCLPRSKRCTCTGTCCSNSKRLGKLSALCWNFPGLGSIHTAMCVLGHVKQ